MKLVKRGSEGCLDAFVICDIESELKGIGREIAKGGGVASCSDEPMALRDNMRCYSSTNAA